jgi:hypothetical protein
MRDPLLAPFRGSTEFQQIEPELRRRFETLSARYRAS